MKNLKLINKITFGCISFVFVLFFLSHISVSNAYAYTDNDIQKARYTNWTSEMKTTFASNPYYFISVLDNTWISIMMFDKCPIMYHMNSSGFAYGILNFTETTNFRGYYWNGTSWNAYEPSTYTSSQYTYVMLKESSSNDIVADNMNLCVIGSNIGHTIGTTAFIGYSSLSYLQTYTPSPISFMYRKFPYTLDESDTLRIPEYTYQYNSEIENVTNLKILKDAIYRSDWGLVIGQSKTNYTVTWDKPVSSNYKIEITYESKFQNASFFNGSTITRRYAIQTYKKPYYVDKEILPNDESLKININTLGATIKKNCWSDIDTGMYITIPPTKMYIRYVRVDNESEKIYYGNWTRIEFASGSQGIIEAKVDKVTTTETVNEDGTITYNDEPIQGNQSEYIDTDNGEVVDEEQSFIGAADTIGSALESVTSAFKNVGVWLGQVPSVFSELFKFMPSEILALLSLGIALVVILRIAGR